MRMEDLVPAPAAPDDEISPVGETSRVPANGLRFTSNVVGSLFLVTDLLCFVLATPVTLAAYSLIRGSRLEVSVHITAFDAVISSLIASALIWQAGLVEHYSRGITLLFLLTVVLCLSVSRPILHRLIARLAKRGQIEQRIAFYGADPDSVALSKQLLESLNFPHLRFVGIADDRARRSEIPDLPMLGDLPRLCELARRGEVDQVLI